MEARLQRRVQRYGWDLAAADYERLWQAQLAAAQVRLLAEAALQPGERVLDVACGTGLVSFPAAGAVGAAGRLDGVDLSGGMVEAAQQRAVEHRVGHASFSRMDAEALALPDAGYDAVLCALGLMYLPSPERGLGEMHRMLRPGGRMVSAVWGERSRCGWSPLFEIVDAEVDSDVCPLFFRLGQDETLARLCREVGFVRVETHRVVGRLRYADADEACAAAFVGGPAALAWSRFDAETRARVCSAYLEAIDAWRDGLGYRVPAEFVVVRAVRRV